MGTNTSFRATVIAVGILIVAALALAVVLFLIFNSSPFGPSLSFFPKPA